MGCRKEGRDGDPASVWVVGGKDSKARVSLTGKHS